MTPPKETTQPAPVEQDVEKVAIPKPVYDFLLGLGDIDGLSFGDRHPKFPGAFWWRGFLATSMTTLTPARAEGFKAGVEAAAIKAEAWAADLRKQEPADEVCRLATAIRAIKESDHG